MIFFEPITLRGFLCLIKIRSSRMLFVLLIIPVFSIYYIALEKYK